MKPKNKQPVTPKLRFPEFRDMGKWNDKKLGEIVALEYGSPLPEKNRKGGRFPVIGSNGIVGYHDEAIVDGPAIVVGRKGSAGQVNWIESDCYPIDTTFFVKNLDPESCPIAFLWRLLERSNLERLGDAGAVPGLNRNEVCLLKTYIPPPAEQQKIADCLSSLDGLIAAAGRKLEALKAHKKGLMQQLFPQPGETQPRLRFPEFRDKGEWVEKPLVELVKFASGGTPSKTDPKFWNGDIPWISASAMHDTVVYDSELKVTQEAIGNGTRLASKGSLLILVRGSMLFKRVPICITERDVAFNQDVKSIRPKRGVDTRYLLYHLIASESRIAINATGIGAGKIDTEHLKSLVIGSPSSGEQKAIADCLTALDTRITAQAAKLDALRTHKRGLMQQLFPAAEGVGA
jgi:type I restriction enzyme, S subunit